MKMVYTWFFFPASRYLKSLVSFWYCCFLPVTAWLVGKYVPKEKEGNKYCAVSSRTTTDK